MKQLICQIILNLNSRLIPAQLQQKKNLTTHYLRIWVTDNSFINPLLKNIKIWNTGLQKDDSEESIVGSEM